MTEKYDLDFTTHRMAIHGRWWNFVVRYRWWKLRRMTERERRRMPRPQAEAVREMARQIERDFMLGSDDR